MLAANTLTRAVLAGSFAGSAGSGAEALSLRDFSSPFFAAVYCHARIVLGISGVAIVNVGYDCRDVRSDDTVLVRNLAPIIVFSVTGEGYLIKCKKNELY